MKAILVFLILIFSFQSWTKADDIKEFEIEGMSVGDSLLNYFSEEEIIKATRENQYEDKDGKNIFEFCASRKHEKKLTLGK